MVLLPELIAYICTFYQHWKFVRQTKSFLCLNNLHFFCNSYPLNIIYYKENENLDRARCVVFLPNEREKFIVIVNFFDPMKSNMCYFKPNKKRI
jgi:hypothetical protein